jgi:hypothetical protein
MAIVEFKAKEPRAPAPTLVERFDTARQEMLAAWTALAKSGTISPKTLVDEISATTNAMLDIQAVMARRP